MVDTICGKSITKIFWLLSIIMLNSLKSEWISPWRANRSTRSSKVLYPISGCAMLFTFCSGNPLMKLIRIACRLLLMGTGTGNSCLCSVSIKRNSLNEEMRER